jgi:hypothetical protein
MYITLANFLATCSSPKNTRMASKWPKIGNEVNVPNLLSYYIRQKKFSSLDREVYLWHFGAHLMSVGALLQLRAPMMWLTRLAPHKERSHQQLNDDSRRNFKLLFFSSSGSMTVHVRPVVPSLLLRKKNSHIKIQAQSYSYSPIRNFWIKKVGGTSLVISWPVFFCQAWK